MIWTFLLVIPAKAEALHNSEAGQSSDSALRNSQQQSIPPAARACHFLLLVQEKVTKEKDTPGYAPSARPCAAGSRVPTGFFDGASMHQRKTACIVHAALRVYPSSPAATQGPQTASGHPARVVKEALWLRVLAEVALTECKTTAHDKTYRPACGA